MRYVLFFLAFVLGAVSEAQVVLERIPRAQDLSGSRILQDSAASIVRRSADAILAERLVSVRGYQALYHMNVDISGCHDSLAALDRIHEELLSVLVRASRDHAVSD